MGAGARKQNIKNMSDLERIGTYTERIGTYTEPPFKDKGPEMAKRWAQGDEEPILQNVGGTYVERIRSV